MTNDKRDEIIIETHTLVKEQAKQITTLFQSIEGNGQPGLKQEMAKMKQVQTSCMEGRKTRMQLASVFIAAASMITGLNLGGCYAKTETKKPSASCEHPVEGEAK